MFHRSRRTALWLMVALTAPAAGPAVAAVPTRARAGDHRLAPRPGWVARIDRLVRGQGIGVAVAEEGRFLYRHADARRRAPASNEKLLLSMALLDRLGPDARLVTQAAAGPVTSGVVAGDLWILGTGDPALGPTRLRELATAVASAGVTRVEGSVAGSTGFFKRDWRAPGWKRDFPRTQVAFPTALTYQGNEAGGEHVRDPELRAARAMTHWLRKAGVQVSADPDAGRAPPGLVPIAEVHSRPLIDLLEYTNRFSSNFFAEVLGKRLGAEVAGIPGSIHKGALAIRSYAAEGGTRVRSLDASGLSYANRVSPRAIVRLLEIAEDQEWGEALRNALPGPGQGTLKGRLRHVSLHAKTGTLSGISALSGWVYLRRLNTWAEFSVLSRGMSKDRAVRIEDQIVRILSRDAR
jgi:D-alanyl-D-alanine carboxypeptidase/D-alanyl-D-alanine-endopeptidase (penicillin-binding protein 4)